jgi:hypothetical protein
MRGYLRVRDVPATFGSRSDPLSILIEAPPVLREAGAIILASLGDGVISILRAERLQCKGES